MTSAADATLYWAVLTRPRGEILIAEARSPGLHLGLLGVPPGFDAAETESWLYDVIGVAHEGSPAPEVERHIPALLRHGLTGLLFSHAELWDRGAPGRPCSFAFVHTVHEVGFGIVGDARVAVSLDGRTIEPEWIAVRDELGREARAWSTGATHDIEVRIEWDRPASGRTHGADVEAVWSARDARFETRPDVAPVAEPQPPDIFAAAIAAGEEIEPAWRELPELIPPTPEPAELAARALALSDPPDPHAIDLPPASPSAVAAETPRPIAPQEEVSLPASPPVQPPPVASGAIEARELPPPTPAAPDLLPPPLSEPELPPPAFTEPELPPPTLTAPELPTPALTAPALSAPTLPDPEPPPRFATPAIPATVRDAETPAGDPARGARRLVFQTAEQPAWPTMRQLTRGEWPLWRRPWLWAAGLLVLFAAGWTIGGMQDNSAPRDVSRRGFIGSALHAIGLGGPRFRVDVASRPAGAWIAVNGRSMALRTPAAVELAPGTHEIALSFPDLGGATYQVRGLKGDRVPLQATLWGSLEVYSPDAVGLIAVTVDGVPRGVAPLRVDSLAPGIHELRFAGPGAAAWSQTVDIRVGETREVLARAFSSPSTGVLQVQANLTDEQGAGPLKGAQVWIDGELRGVTPLTVDLPHGPHSVRVAHRGQEAPVQVIDLPGGNQRFAVFEFGLDLDRPALLVDLPPRLPRERPTVISASLQGANEVREMWLHTQMPGGPWRRYPMTIMKSPTGLVGVTTFPLVVFDAQGRARYYVSAMYGQGDESFTEIRTVQLDKPPAR